MFHPNANMVSAGNNSLHQTEHFLVGLFFWSGLQLNTLPNSAKFDVEPITLQLPKKYTVESKDCFKPMLIKIWPYGQMLIYNKHRPLLIYPVSISICALNKG